MRSFLLFLAVFLLSACAPTGPAIHIPINLRQPGEAISSDFEGLSYEAAQLLPRPDGSHYFSPENTRLVTLFKTLGIKSLRIGGNSVDRENTNIPTDADIDSLFKFAEAAGTKVIYSVRLLNNGSPTSAARIAKFIYEHHAATLDCFAIGNEPNSGNLKDYDTYHEKWKAIMDAMIAVAPNAKFCGPDTNPSPAWCKNLVAEFAKSDRFTMITQHDYPGGCAYRNPNVADIANLIPNDPAVAREKMLTSAWYARYEKVQKGMADAVAGTPIRFRMDETNSLWFGGLKGASDSYASALWSIDYLYWWAAHGAAGLNFHTGDLVGGGDKSLPSRYTVFVTAGKGYDIHPIAYGMKFFDLGGRGKIIPVVLPSSHNDDLVVYATLSGGKIIDVSIINRSHGATAAEAVIALDFASPLSNARSITLIAPHGDIAATSGITLGGHEIQSDGTWNADWTSLWPSGTTIRVRVPAASATVVEAHTVQ